MAPRAVMIGLLVGAAVIFAAASSWRARLAALALLAAIFGLAHANRALTADRAARGAWEQLWGQTVRLEGLVLAVEPRGATVRLTVGALAVLPGTLRATVAPLPSLAAGARVAVSGKLERPEDIRPPGVTPRGDLERVFSRHQVFSVVQFPTVRVLAAGRRTDLDSLRGQLRQRFLRILPEPSAGFYSAFLLSFGADLPKALRDAAGSTGILHLVAISGSHIAAIATFVFGAGTALGLARRGATILTLALTTFFLALIGFPESGVRSGIMAAFVAAAYLLGRPAAGERALLLAVALMTMQNPRILLGDVGFQLSTLAVWGLLALYPLFRDATVRWPDPFRIRSLFFLALAAEIATLPVVAYAFGRVPLIGPLTNLAAGALFLPLLALGALTLALSPLGPAVTTIVGPVADAGARAFLTIGAWGSRIPFHALSLPPLPLSALLVSVAGVIAVVEVLRRRRRPAPAFL